MAMLIGRREARVPTRMGADLQGLGAACKQAAGGRRSLHLREHARHPVPTRVPLGWRGPGLGSNQTQLPGCGCVHTCVSHTSSTAAELIAHRLTSMLDAAGLRFAGD